jgi:Ca2+-transporting ATPase
MYISQDINQVLGSLGVTTKGLSSTDVETRVKQYGLNELPEKKRSLVLLFLSQFNDAMVFILFAALGISIAMPFFENGGAPHAEAFIDAGVIAAILFLNAVLGFVQEYKAEEAIAMLKKLTAPHTRVRRDGKESIVESKFLVPGDIVILEAGDRVAADGRLIRESQIRMNESSLTGETNAVDKDTEPLSRENYGLADQKNMLFAGTMVTNGNGEFVVTSIALHTEIGKIAKLVSDTEFPETPLQKKMKQLGLMLGGIVLTMCAAVFGIGIYRGLPLADVLLMSVSLAVSAVPEGLPAVVTVCLAMGVRRMAKSNALVRRLESLETLGSVSVICTDKTGTITENKMKVVDSWLSDDADKTLLAQIGASCNRAQLPDVGDPTEIGLLEFAESIDSDRLKIDEEQVPFSSEDKYMQTRHSDQVFIKGATEKIIALSGKPCSDVLSQSTAFEKQGLRVLACAVKEAKAVKIVGLIAMEDPPRKTVTSAIAEAATAGIRTVMITGDSLITAKAIAQKVGIHGEAMHGEELEVISEQDLAAKLSTVAIFARVSPEHKLKILSAFKLRGEIVAMTGDGVNDAPAIKGAHVGIAMGKVGTEVAREAASIVLSDDKYETMVTAIAEGRRIYDNIKKFVLYLLRANFDELLFIGLAIFIGLPLPYLPLHILWINLMTDGLPALALGMEPAEKNIMKRPPRSPTEHLLDGEWGRLIFSSLLGFSASFLFYLWRLSEGMSLELARTETLTLAIMFELFLAFSTRSSQPIWKVGLFSNKWMIGATLIPFIAQFILLYTPLGNLFYLEYISLHDWLIIACIAIIPIAILECMKCIPRNKTSI